MRAGDGSRQAADAVTKPAGRTDQRRAVNNEPGLPDPAPQVSQIEMGEMFARIHPHAALEDFLKGVRDSVVVHIR
jgi:hypothetical protein